MIKNVGRSQVDAFHSTMHCCMTALQCQRLAATDISVRFSMRHSLTSVSAASRIQLDVRSFYLPFLYWGHKGRVCWDCLLDYDDTCNICGLRPPTQDILDAAASMVNVSRRSETCASWLTDNLILPGPGCVYDKQKLACWAREAGADAANMILSSVKDFTFIHVSSVHELRAKALPCCLSSLQATNAAQR